MVFIKRLIFWLLLPALLVSAALVFFPGGFELSSLEFADKKVRIPKVSVAWNFKDLRSPRITLEAPKVHLPASEAAMVSVVFKKDYNTLSIASLGSKKAALEDVRATFTWHGSRLEFDRIRSRFAGQELLGTATVWLGREPRYRLSLSGGSLPGQAVVDAFEWQKKLAVAGVFTGRLEMEGSGGTLSRLEGSFDAAPEGGTITILDQEMLQRVADSSHQPLSIVRASFENYHYNTGKARFHLDRSDLRLEMALEGEAGKRQLEVNLHDLFPQT